MKKYAVIPFIIILTMMTGLTGCGKSELACIENTGKTMTFSAKNADDGGFIITGTLDVAEGENIIIEPALKKGGICFEFLSTEGFDDIEEVPDVEGAEVLFTANVSGEEAQSYGDCPGQYMLRVTCKGKTTGEVVVKSMSSVSDE